MARSSHLFLLAIFLISFATIADNKQQQSERRPRQRRDVEEDPTYDDEEATTGGGDGSTSPAGAVNGTQPSTAATATEPSASAAATATEPSASAAETATEPSATAAAASPASPSPANIDPDWLVDISIDPFPTNLKWQQFVKRVKQIQDSFGKLTKSFAGSLSDANQDYTADKAKYLSHFLRNFTTIWAKFDAFFAPFHEQLFESAPFLEINPAIGLTNLNTLIDFIKTKPTGQRDQTRMKWVQLISIAVHSHYVFDRLKRQFSDYNLHEIEDVLGIQYPSWKIVQVEGDQFEIAPYVLLTPIELIEFIHTEIISLGEQNHLFRGLERILRKSLHDYNPRDTDLNKYCYGMNKFATIHDEFDLLTDAALYLVLADMKMAVVQTASSLYNKLSGEEKAGDSLPNSITINDEYDEIMKNLSDRVERKINLGQGEDPNELIAEGPLIMNCDVPPKELETCVRDPMDPQVVVKNGVVLIGETEAKIDPTTKYALYENGTQIPGVEPVKTYTKNGVVLNLHENENNELVDVDGNVVQDVEIQLQYQVYIYVPAGQHNDEFKLIIPSDGQWGKYDCKEQIGKEVPEKYRPGLPANTPRLEPQCGPIDNCPYPDNRRPNANQTGPNDNLISFTKAFTGYLEAELALSPKGSCVGTCPDYRQPTAICENSDHCPLLRDSVCEEGQTGCLKESKCPSRARRCQRTSPQVQFCPSTTKTRLYDWLQINGQIRSILFPSNDTAEQPPCEQDVVKAHERWAMENNLVLTAPQYCELCLCVCDEAMSEDGKHYVDLGQVKANVEDGFVVTGFKFVQVENVLRLNIEQGKLLPNGQIDQSTVKWLDSPAIDADKSNYLPLSTNSGFRRINLDIILARSNELVTGLKFVHSDGSLSLEGQLSKFNVDPSGELSLGGDGAWTAPHYPKPIEPRQPIPLGQVSSPLTQNGPSQPFNLPDNSKSLEFDVTSLLIDGGQAVVPFFDGQPAHAPTVERVPLQGVGFLYKSKRGSGGFVAPTVVLYQKSF